MPHTLLSRERSNRMDRWSWIASSNCRRARAVDRAAAARVAEGRSVLADDAANLGCPRGGRANPASTEEVEDATKCDSRGCGRRNRESRAAARRERAPAPGRREEARGESMIVCLDANIVIYLVEQNPIWEPKVSARIAAFRAAGDEIAVSDAARLECLVGPFRPGTPPTWRVMRHFSPAQASECCRLRSRFGKEPRRFERITVSRLSTRFIWPPRSSMAALAF